MKNWIEKMKKRFKNQKGLTLVELLAVIVILAIVGGIAFVMIGNVIENSKKDAHIANAQQLISAAKLHDAQGGEFPGGSGNAVTITNEELKTAGLMGEFINPWEAGTAYSGTVTKTTSTTNQSVSYTVSLTGDGGKCELTDESEEDLAKGREEVCKP